MKLRREQIKPVIVLGTICLVVALLLAAVNLLTAPVVEENTEREIRESLEAVIPGGSFETTDFVVPDTVHKNTGVSAVYRETGSGSYVVVLTARSQYTGSDLMGITLAVSGEGRIIGVKITTYSESKDFGQKTYPETYIGADLSAAESADLVAGVTYSSTAFRQAVTDALRTLAANGFIGTEVQ